MKNVLLIALLLIFVFTGCTGENVETVVYRDAEETETTTVRITNNAYEVIEVYDSEGGFYKMLVIADTIGYTDTVSY